MLSSKVGHQDRIIICVPLISILLFNGNDSRHPRLKVSGDGMERPKPVWRNAASRASTAALRFSSTLTGSHAPCASSSVCSSISSFVVAARRASAATRCSYHLRRVVCVRPADKILLVRKNPQIYKLHAERTLSGRAARSAAIAVCTSANCRSLAARASRAASRRFCICC